MHVGRAWQDANMRVAGRYLDEVCSSAVIGGISMSDALVKMRLGLIKTDAGIAAGELRVRKQQRFVERKKGSDECLALAARSLKNFGDILDVWRRHRSTIENRVEHLKHERRLHLSPVSPATSSGPSTSWWKTDKPHQQRVTLRLSADTLAKLGVAGPNLNKSANETLRAYLRSKGAGNGF